MNESVVLDTPKADVAVSGFIHLTGDPRIILVTGAAGSIGVGVIKILSEHYPKTFIRAFDNDEYGLFHLREECPSPKIQPFLGDVKDANQVALALEGVHTVIHLAAIKRIEIAEHNPIESIKTNVLGTANLIQESIKLRDLCPRQFLLISSDKALPSNDMLSLYGSTKLQQEYLTMWAYRRFKHYCAFSISRFGNVIDSRGNVFEIWEDARKAGMPLPLTDKNMKRYFWKNKDAALFILRCLNNMVGGEIFVPRIEQRLVTDYMGESESYEIIGLRPGETLFQRLMSPREEQVAKSLPWCYKICVNDLENW